MLPGGKSGSGDGGTYNMGREARSPCATDVSSVTGSCHEDFVNEFM